MLLMSDLIVDTYKLNDYANRLAKVNTRLVKLDFRMDGLYTKVGLAGLHSLLKADLLTGYNWQITRIEIYLRQTANDFEKIEKKLDGENPLDFNRPVGSEVKDFFYDVGVGIKKSAKQVKSAFENTISVLADSYYSHGTVYKVVQYGKAVLSTAEGVSKIVIGVGSLFGTGGMSAPIAVLSIISGCNDVYNSFSDIAYMETKQYDKVGQNFLKDKLVEGGKTVGSKLGNERIGEAVGAAAYYGIDIVIAMNAIGLSMDKLKQMPKTDMSKLGTEMKDIVKMDHSGLFKMDLETFKYQTKLAGYTYTETANAVSKLKVFGNIATGTLKIGNGVNDIYTTYNKDFKNPVLDKLNTASNIYNMTKGAVTLTTWNYKDSLANAKQVDSLFVVKKNNLFFSKEYSDFRNGMKDYVGNIKSAIDGGKKLYDDKFTKGD